MTKILLIVAILNGQGGVIRETNKEIVDVETCLAVQEILLNGTNYAPDKGTSMVIECRVSNVEVRLR